MTRQKDSGEHKKTEFPKPKLTPVRVTINHDRPLPEAITIMEWKHHVAPLSIQEGRVDPEITRERFPKVGTGKEDADLFLVWFNRDMSDPEIDAALVRLDLVDEGLESLMAFGMKYPNYQRQFPIAARRSSWTDLGDRNIPYLCNYARKRYLSLHRVDSRGGWNRRYRFLVRCKKKA